MTGTTGPAPGWLDDPREVHPKRYWDGQRYTEWVVTAAGETIRDGQGASPPPPPAGPPLRLSPAANGTARASSATSPAPHAGDAVLSLISKVTLQSWLSNRVAQGMWLPEVGELARRRPRDPRALLMLGTRMRDFERVRSRISRSGTPITLAGAVLRPVVRPVMKAAANAISSSDGIPASTKVLSAAWHLTHWHLERRPNDASLLCLMARHYLNGRAPEMAWETAVAASRVQPDRGEAYYIMSEAAFECGDHQKALRWAREAVNRGCTLGFSLTRHDSPFRRNSLLTSKASAAMPSVDDYWQAFASYYEGADPRELYFFFGPQPISGDRS